MIPVRKWAFTLVLMAGVSADPLWVSYGWQVFQSAADARAVALGGAQIADGRWNAARIWNPALTSRSLKRYLAYTHQNRFSGLVGYDLVSLPVFSAGSLPAGLTILHESITGIPDSRSLLLDWGTDGIPGTGDSGEGNGILDEGERLKHDQVQEFQQRQVALHVSTSWDWSGGQFGLAFKWLHHTLGEYRGNGLGFDLGYTRPLWSRARLGVTLYDFMTSWTIWDSGILEISRPALGLGFQQVLPVTPLALEIRCLFDVLMVSGKTSLTDDLDMGILSGGLKTGFEIVYNQHTALRFGRNRTGGLSTGLGLMWDILILDYAYQFDTATLGLGNSHYISFAMDMDWLQRFLDDIR